MIKTSITVLLAFSLFLKGDRESFEKIMLKMEHKILQNKKVSTSNAEIFYSVNGDMVTHTSYPKEVFMINNRKGSLSVYNPEENTVMVIENFSYSTENSQFYFFLQNKKSDMGLKSMGFTLEDTKVENGNVITWWIPPGSMRKVLKRIMLVHKEGRPIYMKYLDKDQNEIKKVYYYDYFENLGITFPTTITQFDYLPNGDSIITRTQYSDLKFNSDAVSNYFEYQIPEDAKLIEAPNKNKN